MNTIIDQIQQSVSQFSPNLLGALLVFIVGWVIALVVAALTRQLLRRAKFNNKLAYWITGRETSINAPVEIWAGKGVFYVIMLAVLVAFFYTLNLSILADPLNLIVGSIAAYLPRILGAGLLLLLAWVVATVFKRLIITAMRGFKLDERLGDAVGGEEKGRILLSQTLSEAVYWLTLLFFLPAILGALQIKALLDPIADMFNKIFAYLPQIFGAGVILLVGWFVARIVQRLAANLLVSAGADTASEKWGLAKSLGKLKLSGLIALIIYYLILLPVVIAALNALQLDAITRPASDMLARITDMLPAIFGAVLVMAIAYVVGRLVAGIINNVLTGAGFNSILVKLGLSRSVKEGDYSPSAMAGKLALIVVLVLASIEAANLLGFSMLAGLIRDFVGWGGHILLGLIIFSLGLLLANWVAGAVRSSDAPQAPLLSTATRVVILLLAGAMALRQMELANDIVNIAFGLAIGSVAVAVAIAFGLGGRDTAARLLEDWSEKFGKHNKE
jgi:Conserved TM helix